MKKKKVIIAVIIILAVILIGYFAYKKFSKKPVTELYKDAMNKIQSSPTQVAAGDATVLGLLKAGAITQEQYGKVMDAGDMLGYENDSPEYVAAVSKYVQAVLSGTPHDQAILLIK